jgi:hypothetical protein
MARGSTPGRVTRLAGGMSLLVAVASAVTLTGAAFFTVNQASCADPATYIRTDGQIELVGGCVDPADLPATRPERSVEQHGVEPGFYQP